MRVGSAHEDGRAFGTGSSRYVDQPGLFADSVNSPDQTRSHQIGILDRSRLSMRTTIDPSPTSGRYPGSRFGHQRIIWPIQRPLEPVCPVIFFDALKIKIHEHGLVCNKAIYWAPDVLLDRRSKPPVTVVFTSSLLMIFFLIIQDLQSV